MKKETNRIGNVFFERGSWHHRFKKLKEDYTTFYGKKGGFSTPEDAEISYKKYKEQYEIQLSKYNLKKNKDILFSDYLKYWYHSIFRKKEIDNNYILGVAYVIFNMVNPLLEKEDSKLDIKLKLLNSNYINSILDELSLISPSSGNKCKEVIGNALSDAVELKYIATNPMNGVKKYKRKRPNVKILSKNELKELLKFSYYDEWYLEILLGVFCGLRKGEILGLKFDDFDLEKNILRIRRQLVINPIITEDINMSSVKVEKYELVEKPPKKDSYRNLRVPKVIINEVIKRKEEYELCKNKNKNFTKLGYVSFNRKNGNPHYPNSLNTYLYRKCPNLGITQISVHSLRHIFATILIEKGVPLIKISALLGHSSPNTTFEIYCDIMDERKRIITFINDTFSPSKRSD